MHINIQKAINKDKEFQHSSLKRNSHSPGTKDGTPPPAMVFPRQLEIRQCNSNTRRDAQQNYVDDKQNSIQCELLSSPQRGKYVVQLHRYGTMHITTFYNKVYV